MAFNFSDFLTKIGDLKTPLGQGVQQAGFGILAHNTGGKETGASAIGKGALMGLGRYQEMTGKQDQEEKEKAAMERLIAAMQQGRMGGQVPPNMPPMPANMPRPAQPARPPMQFPGQTPGFNPNVPPAQTFPVPQNMFEPPQSVPGPGGSLSQQQQQMMRRFMLGGRGGSYG